jgi:hypothetical protein
MKNQSILKFAALLLICCAMLGCGKESPTSTIETKIYGTVFDEDTGNPIQGAEIRFGIATNISHAFLRSISSSVSGADGQYEVSFGKLPGLDVGEVYSLLITKDYTKQIQIEIVEGNSHRLDINM